MWFLKGTQCRIKINKNIGGVRYPRAVTMATKMADFMIFNIWSIYEKLVFYHKFVTSLPRVLIFGMLVYHLKARCFIPDTLTFDLDL